MKTLVIVGGTGSLGNALLEQTQVLIDNNIGRIRILSRDEQKQSILEKKFKTGLGDRYIELQCFLADIRNYERMEFGLRDAHYVIHAAALKMVERFELDVDEGYETNINGTRNVLKAFLKSPYAQSGILVSTDKSVQPINAYGVSKLAAQHAWLWGNTFQSEVKLGVNIYGNVYGSRGSVIEYWDRLAKEKKALPVTDARMTRFFISRSDAAYFVLESLFNNNRSIMVPDMKATPMLKVASAINGIHKNKSGYVEIGLRSGEKLHEVLPKGQKIVSSNKVKEFSSKELIRMHRRWALGA